MSETTDPIVIIGGGLTGGTAVTALRERGYDGPIVLLAEENHVPYERPPLSKGYLLGQEELSKADVHDQQWYDDNDVELRLGASVTAIDPAGHTVTVAGEPLRYRSLLIATGARPRRLALADNSGVPVHYLRTIEDAVTLRGLVGPGITVGIIGAGWIGLEAAAAARTAGSEVVVWEYAPTPLRAALGEEVGNIFAQLHREHGVDLRTGITLTAIEADDDRIAVTEGDGRRTVVDVLVVGVGVEPNSELAEAAGIATDNGILTDAQLRTSVSDVYAAGDVANADNTTLGRRLRVEHWDTARKHGAIAAAGLIGEDAANTDQPYFFTDQYALGMEYVGNPGPEGFDRVVIKGDTEGPVESRVFRVYWLRGDLVVAAMQANDWDATDRLRELVGTHVTDAELT